MSEFHNQDFGHAFTGGYDRGECLSTVESFDINTNTWTPLSHMLTPRGRFDATQLAGCLYACGGSNGSQELKSAECYDIQANKWMALPDMPHSRTSAGRRGFLLFRINLFRG